MLPLNLPSASFKIIKKDNREFIFDTLRKKYVALTPEEWVRQNFVNYLLKYRNYPVGLLANEVQISLNSTRKRCDTVLYDRSLKARMIIEYKAPSVNITQEVFNQITRYNIVLKVDYLIVSNGINHYCCKVDYQTGKYTFLRDIPEYSSLD